MHRYRQVYGLETSSLTPCMCVQQTTYQPWLDTRQQLTLAEFPEPGGGSSAALS